MSNIMEDTMVRSSLLTTISALAVIMTTPAMAKEELKSTNREESPQGIVLDEIVVTSRKREESLQRTPLSVMAFTSADIEKANIVNILDLGVRLPNVNIAGAGGAGTNNASFAIRGLGSGSRNSPNSENAVGLYIDDAYYGKTDGALLDVIDVERIEVLRGPQGTLFGRNSTAGAIRYITKKPHFDNPEGNIALTLGRYDRRDLKASLNLPISETIATRWTVASLNRDGYVHNAITNEDLGSQDTFAIRGAVLVRPNDKLDINLSGDYTKSNSTGAPTVATITNLTPNGGIWGAPFAATEDAENIAKYGFGHDDVPTNDRFTSYGAGPHFTKRRSIGANLVLDYSINDNLALKSATTYRYLKSNVGYDMDGTPAELVGRIMDRDIKVFTQEVQLSGTAENIQWVAGAFYLWEEVKSFQDDFRMINADNVNGIQGGQLVDPHTTKSAAIFGQATYSVSDSFDITGGLRYTNDKKHQTVFNVDFPGGTRNDVSLESDTSDSWGALSGRLSLEWTVNDNTFTYASYARGFRSGGLNDEGPTTPFTSYDKETVNSFELGIRSDLIDNRLRTNLTAFYTDAQDLQLTVLLNQNDNDTVTDNAGSAKIYGLEAEVTAILTKYISFGLNAGYLNSQYKEVPPFSDEFVPIKVGDSLTNAPKYSFSAQIDIDIPIATGELETNISYSWKDDYSLFPGIESKQEAFGLLGFNVTYTNGDGDWSVSIFGTNVLNQEYANIIMDIGGAANSALGFKMIEPGRPRELGVSLKYNF
ncbi:MAG: hypothetical protein COA47_05250 [Robiginitomaculum sp.]|nr:MAG: hypothetical protein COA47_05250 [Robiginitomaculum sp.]